MKFDIRKSRVFLSRLKNRLVGLDLQDIYEMQMPCEDRHQPADPDNISYCLHSHIEALDLVEQVRPLSPDERHFARARLQRGDRLVVGSLDRSPVFYGWLMFGELEMTYDVFLPAPAQSAFGYNLFTSHRHRRKGLMTRFYQFASRYLRGRNCDRLLVGISLSNKASIKAHVHNGFVKTGYFYTVRLLGTCFTFARFEQKKRFYMTTNPGK